MRACFSGTVSLLALLVLLIAATAIYGTLSENYSGVRLAICDSLSLATFVSLNDLGASALESQNRKPDPGFGPSGFGPLRFRSPL